jgi:rfaE bifunctional protein kinase chain/domain
MTIGAQRFEALTARYSNLKIGLVGDFCLDRYLEIDPSKAETSIETGLTVYNVVHVRSQPGGAGTILNNLVALGIGTIYPVGFAGIDGEGMELRRAMRAKTGVDMRHFLSTRERRTFTYTKPLVLKPGQPPEELNRLDMKNWSATPPAVEGRLVDSLRKLAREVNAIVLLDQVDTANTGVVTTAMLDAIRAVRKDFPNLLILADSRRGLAGYPPVGLKMNRAELGALTGMARGADIEKLKATARELSQSHGNYVFITLSEQGILGANADGQVAHIPCLPVRGPIDIVGAGDAVTADLAAALAAGAELTEALELANAAASVVIHQLGTTGTASVDQVRALVGA